MKQSMDLSLKTQTIKNIQTYQHLHVISLKYVIPDSFK